MRKTKFLTLALIISFTLFSSSVVFAQAQKGTIKGFVTDSQSGEAMPFASVYIDGTTIGTITNEKGFYILPSVNSGSYKLTTNYIGYILSSVDILIKTKDTIVQNFSLKINTNELKGVSVTAQASAQMKAINIQITALNIKNVISDKKIRELPDANAAEALSRLPGVAISRSGGEATGITIRGVSQNATYVNGMRLDGGLGGIAASMIGSIEMNKAFMPDQDANSLGGLVEFKMREAKQGWKKEFWIKQGYNGFTKSLKMQEFSGMVSNRFLKGKLGVLLSVNYDRKDRGRDNIQVNYKSQGVALDFATIKKVYIGPDYLDPTNSSLISLTHSENLNNRYGITFFTDYTFPHGKIFFQSFLTALVQKNMSTSNSYSTGTQLEYSTDISTVNKKNIINGIGGDYTLKGIKINWGVSLSLKRNSTPESLNLGALNSNGGTGFIVDSSTTVDQYISHYTHDITKTRLGKLNTSPNKDNSDEYSYKIDIEIPLNISKQITGNIKLGGKISDITRSYFRPKDGIGDFMYYSPQPVQIFTNKLLPGLPDYGWTYTDPLTQQIPGYQVLSGKDNVSFSLLDNIPIRYLGDFDKIKYIADYTKSDPDAFGYTLKSTRDNYEYSENDYATYIMSVLNFGKHVTFIPGVRYEYEKFLTTGKNLKTSQQYWGPDESQGVIKDTTAGNTNKRFFPYFHLKIKPTSWFDLRLSYTQTETRPDYTYLNPKRFVDENGGKIIDEGNPYLRPQINTNYDAYFSFYSKKTGLFTFGLFYKILVDITFSQAVAVNRNKITGELYGNLPASYENYILTKPTNFSEPGYVKGMEADWQTQFSFLPFPFNGIVLNANLTLMDSKINYPATFSKKAKFNGKPFAYTVDTVREDRIIGMPNVVGNLAIGYDLKGFSGRISAYYQGSTTYSVRALDRSTDQERVALLRFDLSLAQRISKAISAYFNIANITNAADKIVLKYYPDKVVSAEKYGFACDIGLRINL